MADLTSPQPDEPIKLEAPAKADKLVATTTVELPEKPAASSSRAAAASSILIGRALKKAQEDALRTPSKSATASTSTATPPSARVQFEQQEDFISFDAEPEEEERPSRFTPRHGGGGGRGGDGGSAGRGSGTKRKLDDFDEKDQEGSKRLAKREKERSTPWCEEPGVDWSSCASATEMLNKECRSFITYISPTQVEHDLRLWTIELIRRTIKSRWSDAEVECFGSVGTGLYLPGGDIDLVVLCPSFPSPPLKPTSSLLHHLASLLLNSSLAEPSSLLVIAKARVPIVKFTTRYGGFSVDLSVNQKGGVDAAIRVRDMLETFAFRDKDYVEPGTSGKGKGKAKDKQSEGGESDSSAEEEEAGNEVVDYGVARSLVMLVKAFLNQRGMNEVFTGGLGSYSIICLVVSFLQLHPKIQTGEILPERNIGLLFVEFLEYYGKHYNYNEAGITLRGRGGYFNKHDKGWYRHNQPYLLSIEDPNDPSNDVSGGSHNIIRVRQTLAGAFEVLNATLCFRASHFAAALDPSHIPLSGAVLPNADTDASSTPLAQSILGSVIGMSRASIASRETNVDLHREGLLQAKIERTNPVSVGSKKAAKRAMKEARAQEKRERTIARLEMKKDEREQKTERKVKKRKLEAEAAAVAKAKAVDLEEEMEEGETGEEEEDNDDEVVEQLKPRKLLFQDEEEDSRYGIASPRPGNGKSKLSREVVYVHGTSTDGTNSGAESEDDDVVVGGHSGGDALRSTSASASVSAQASAINSRASSVDSRREAVADAGQDAKRNGKAEKKARMAKRNAFWSQKGGRS